uniref:JmjC domain-containing protein n=1 Tax=Tetradesmus obliquus TaxID=3088 RepID=A0A383WM06_TETOB
MLDVARFMGSQHAVLLDQYAGEGVSVKAGWMHWVANLQPCIKIAFEVLRPQDAAGVLQMQRYMRCVCPKHGDDCMRSVQHVAAELLEWAKVLPAGCGQG